LGEGEKKGGKPNSEKGVHDEKGGKGLESHVGQRKSFTREQSLGEGEAMNDGGFPEVKKKEEDLSEEKGGGASSIMFARKKEKGLVEKGKRDTITIMREEKKKKRRKRGGRKNSTRPKGVEEASTKSP